MYRNIFNKTKNSSLQHLIPLQSNVNIILTNQPKQNICTKWSCLKCSRYEENLPASKIVYWIWNPEYEIVESVINSKASLWHPVSVLLNGGFIPHSLLFRMSLVTSVSFDAHLIWKRVLRNCLQCTSLFVNYHVFCIK